MTGPNIEDARCSAALSAPVRYMVRSGIADWRRMTHEQAATCGWDESVAAEAWGRSAPHACRDRAAMAVAWEGKAGAASIQTSS